MKSIVDEFLASLEARFAECPMISLSLEAAAAGLRLVAQFEAHTDGIVRHYDFTLPASPPHDPDRQLRELIRALSEFEQSIEAATRAKSARFH